VCFAGVDDFLGQSCLAWCATNNASSFSKISCVYNGKSPDSFYAWFASAFDAKPEAKMCVTANACDYQDAKALSACFSGCKCVIICPPMCMDPVEMKSWCSMMVQCCKSAGVEQILCLSCVGCDMAGDQNVWQGADPKALQRWFECEAICRAAYPECPILRCGFFQEWFAAWLPMVKQGSFQACWGIGGEGGMAPVNCDDVAKCVCRILCSAKLLEQGRGFSFSPQFKSHVFNLTGPSCYDGIGIANCFAKQCPGTRYKSCTVRECKSMLEKVKWDKWTSEQCVAWMRLASTGECGFVSGDVKEICNDEGCSFMDWVEQNKDLMRA